MVASTAHVVAGKGTSRKRKNGITPSQFVSGARVVAEEGTSRKRGRGIAPSQLVSGARVVAEEGASRKRGRGITPSQLVSGDRVVVAASCFEKVRVHDIVREVFDDGEEDGTDELDALDALAARRVNKASSRYEVAKRLLCMQLGPK